jgi:alpha-mannosidase
MPVKWAVEIIKFSNPDFNRLIVINYIKNNFVILFKKLMMKRELMFLFTSLILVGSFINPIFAQVRMNDDFKIYLVLHSHSDLSWPGTPEFSTGRNVQAMKQSIEILKDYPEFKFSEEDVFVLQEFLRRYPSQTEEVRDLLQKNILECGAFYMGPSETLLGGEGLIRNIYLGKGWLKSKFGLNTEFAWNVDVPGHTLQMPQILSKAGINNFIIWKIIMRNNLNVTGYVGPPLFRWQSPDGSTILVVSCPEGYFAGYRLRSNNFNIVEEFINGFTKRQTARHNEFNLSPIIFMAEGVDCSVPDPQLVISTERWNEKYDNPEIKLATANEYFEAVEDAEQKGKGKIQTIMGELPSWWDGTQSVENTAFMLSRRGEYLLITAEKFSAINDLLLPGYDYPQTAINEAWEGKQWVHEHNWGGTDGIISDAVKLANARNMYKLSDNLVSSTFGTLIQNIRCKNRGIPLVVFNSLAWGRTDVVDHVVLIEEQGINELNLTDKNGNSVPSQIKTLSTHPDGSIAMVNVIFEALVPSLGYATFYLVEGKNKTTTSLTASSTKLENQFFNVEIDPKTGGITSIYDKVNKKEILNTSMYKGNELIALENLGVDEGEEFTDKWWRMGDKPATVTLVESGPVRATVKVEGLILNSERIQEITLYASLPRIDLKTDLDWDGTKEIQVNATFPFKVDNGRLTYEVPFGMVEYGKESPHAKACHPTVRAANNWMNISNESMGITLATDVTPFDTKDRIDPQFHDAKVIEGKMEPTTYTMDRRGAKEQSRINLQDPLLLETDFVLQPILLRSVFSIGDPDLYFTQEGKHSFRFSISTHKGELVPHNAVHRGWEHNSPLIVMKGQSRSGSFADHNSFFEVSQPNIIMSILKKAEDGNGIVVRCYETDGKNSIITIQGPGEIRNAKRINIIEEELNQEDSFPINNNKVEDIYIGKFAIETLRLNL